MPTMSRTLRLSTLLLACASPLCAHAIELDPSVTATSDYVWRGVSQTLGDPTLQAGVRASTDAGAYASAWASGVDFGEAAGADVEVDLALGWRLALGEAHALDVGVVRYLYPGADLDLDWTEAVATLELAGRAWLAVGASDDAMASGERGTHVLLGLRQPLGERWGAEVSAGRYLLGGDAPVRRYDHAQLALTWAASDALSLRLAWHATDRDARRLFGDAAAGDRAELAATLAF